LLSFLTALRQARLLVLIALLGLLTSFSARASVGVVLNESLDESMDRITGTGHTAVYFSKTPSLPPW
jgi:hypothetical protein